MALAYIRRAHDLPGSWAAQATPYEPAVFTEPSNAEIEQVVARAPASGDVAERPDRRRKADWARHERERRLSQLERTRRTPRLTGDAASFVQRSEREAQLAAEGAMSLLFGLSQ